MDLVSDSLCARAESFWHSLRWELQHQHEVHTAQCIRWGPSRVCCLQPHLLPFSHFILKSFRTSHVSFCNCLLNSLLMLSALLQLQRSACTSWVFLLNSFFKTCPTVIYPYKLSCKTWPDDFHPSAPPKTEPSPFLCVTKNIL
jgi:hypothetical protein